MIGRKDLAPAIDARRREPRAGINERARLVERFLGVAPDGTRPGASEVMLRQPIAVGTTTDDAMR